MYIWNVNDGSLVTVDMMSSLYIESNTGIFGLYSYITGGFDAIDSSTSSTISLTINPGSAVALENSISTWGNQLLNNLTSITPVARITDSFNLKNPEQSVILTIPANTTGYIFLNICLNNGTPGGDTYTTTNTFVFSPTLPTISPPIPTLANNWMIGQVLLYQITSGPKSVTYISDLGPTRTVSINNTSQVVDQFLRNYYSPLNYLLTAELVSQGNGFEDTGVYFYPTSYLPSYSSILLGNGFGGNNGQVYQHNMKSVGSSTGNLADLAFVLVTPAIQKLYPQFTSTGVYIVETNAPLNAAGVFIADSVQYQLGIPNPFKNPVTTTGCYFIMEYSLITQPTQEIPYTTTVPGILIGNSQATTGYHALLLGYNGSLYDVAL